MDGEQTLVLGITLEGWLTLVAIVLGPIIALGVQREIDRRRALEARKLTVFKELMATRAAKLTPRHVEALNAIEMEFSGKSSGDIAVSRAWRLYLDHLNDQTVKREDEGSVARWADKANDLLVDLLFEMGKALKFDFDKVWLKKGIYTPRAHGELEDDQLLLRKYLLELMAGKRAMWTGVFTGDRPLAMELAASPLRKVPEPQATPQNPGLAEKGISQSEPPPVDPSV
jgi:hypothetical protein